MTSPAHCTTASAVPTRPLTSVFASFLIESMNVLNGFAQKIDSWLASRKRVAEDLDALASMSDRELVDIGLNRASVNFVGSGGRVRDYPF
jgi:uncharacterized protein YjiS (DUF1127 family)